MISDKGKGGGGEQISYFSSDMGGRGVRKFLFFG